MTSLNVIQLVAESLGISERNQDQEVRESKVGKGGFAEDMIVGEVDGIKEEDWW